MADTPGETEAPPVTMKESEIVLAIDLAVEHVAHADVLTLRAMALT